MKRYLLTVAMALGAAAAFGQQQTSTVIEGRTIAVKYAAPTAQNRAAASFHTDADLAFRGVIVPKGDYTIYVIADSGPWQLAINKAIGAKAQSYDPKLDLGRIPLSMTASPAAAACKITLTKTAALAAKLEVVWKT